MASLAGLLRFRAEILAFLLTAIEGSTAPLGRPADNEYAQILAGHQAPIRSALAAHDDREMDTPAARPAWSAA